MLIEKKSIAELRPAKYNPRKKLKPGDKEYEKLKRSLTEFGYVDPVIWNKQTGNVVGGHQRLTVLQDMGETEIDCVIVNMPEDREKALNVALNKVAGEWDAPLLEDLLRELSLTTDATLTGFDTEEIDLLLGKTQEIQEDDFDVEKAVKEIETPISQHGDVFLLGSHRLMCGDSTSVDDIAKLMAGNLSDMVFTDPPYNVALGMDETPEQAKKRNRRTDGLVVKNDKMSNEDFYNFLSSAFKSMLEVVVAGGAIYVCHADSEGLNFRKAMIDTGWMIKQCIIWIKNSLIMGRQDHQWQHEPILYGWKPGASHRWYGGRKQSTVIKAEDGVFVNKTESGYQLTFNDGVKKVIIKVPSYELVDAIEDDATTTWYIDKPVRNGEHPTMKPIKLCARAVKNSSKPGNIILDPFGGSGSTLMACEQLGRSCYTMEFDPVYSDVIIKRWEQFTGKKAEKLVV